MKSFTYQDALTFLDRRVNFERFRAIPSPEREFKLDRMRELLRRLGDPQDKTPIVHIAGTKGKGSTAAMIAAALSAAGYVTGLFTSPHLESVLERIAVGGVSCKPEDFAEIIAEIAPAVEDMDAEANEVIDRSNDSPARTESPTSDEAFFPPHGPTYFEILTAAAFVHFAKKKTDAAVIEVGLGGRLDSTNVCTPQLAVITSVGFDHTEQLGNTLAAIAGEKAGIVKPNVASISGVTESTSQAVVRSICKERNSAVAELETDFDFTYVPPKNLETAESHGRIDVFSKTAASSWRMTDVEVSLHGRHQAKNAAIAVAALFELRRQGWNVSDDAIRTGLKSLQWPGRVEIVRRRPTVILDAAHNPDSAEALVRTIQESFHTERRFLILAATAGKDLSGMLTHFIPFFNEIFITRYVSNPRAVPPEEALAEAQRICGREYPTFSDPQSAWQAVSRIASSGDLICIAGSFFIVGEMRKLVQA